MKNSWDIIVVGGGAAGFFAAINAKMLNPGLSVLILEQAKDVLGKVRISGGGRCNVTHHCFDAKTLAGYYPRGNKELLGPFYTFGAKDMIDWLENQGVRLYTEPDGCMFPVSNSSSTIIQCFLDLSKEYGIHILTNQKVKDFDYLAEGDHAYRIETSGGVFSSRMMMLATGASPFVWRMMEAKGYSIVPPCPSLFTFNLPGHAITALMGIVVEDVRVSLTGFPMVTDGPLLITHWGLSGPAVLKASAWGARFLFDKNYEAEAVVDWVPGISPAEILASRESMARKKVISNTCFNLPGRLWQFLIKSVLADPEKNWASLTKQEMNDISRQLKSCSFPVKGKTTYKEEFVTAGGIHLSQINFKTFESKLHPGLFIAGEVLDIDAVTGGFNFQAAWTGGYLAAMEMARR